jgi:glycerol-3-phosphate dehydrogenase
VRQLLDTVGLDSGARVRLVKGSHIVVPRLFEGDHAYILQQPDRRIVFAIPYEGDFTEIGTTDVPVERPEDAVCSADEVAYLCDALNRYFARRTSPADVVWRWSGVRPLVDDGSAAAQRVTRDYLLEIDRAGAPILAVFGGKITTARALAEEAVEKIGLALDVPTRASTRARVFPGGAIARFERFVEQVRARWPFLGDDRSRRMAHAYGNLLGEMLGDIQDEAGMGQPLGAGLTEVEARWMREREWARTPEDVLFRRSKLGLRMDEGDRARLAAWWQATIA